MDFPLIFAAAEAGTSWISHAPTVIWNILLVLIGVNLLIIVHEFGHFIVARMCGVRCDKFYIWFDVYGWKFFKFKWGDTEYGLGVLPLGGYVKMLGQEDNPGAIKAEIDRAKQASDLRLQTSEESGESESEARSPKPEATLTAEEIAQLETSLYAKDSYLSKSVPQRLAIITAGVIMNFIFAFICACGAYSFGILDIAPVVGNTAPGSNAWKADLQPGDRILEVDGAKVKKFSDVQLAIIRTSNPESNFVIERPGVAEPIEMNIAPMMEGKALSAAIGIINSQNLTLAQTPFSPFVETNDEYKKLKGGETLQKIDGQEIVSFHEAKKLLSERRRVNVTLTFAPKSGAAETVEVTFAPIPKRTTGLRFKASSITALREQGTQFGFELGDLITSFDGKSIDAIRLPMLVFEKSQNGGGMVEFVVERNGEPKTLSVDIPARQYDSHVDPFMLTKSICSDILGIAYCASTETSETFGDIPAGSTLEKITLLTEPRKDLASLLKELGIGKETQNGYEIPNSDSIPNFALFLESFIAPVFKTDDEFKLTFRSGDKTLESIVKIINDEQCFEDDCGLIFDTHSITLKADNFAQMLQMGGRATVDNTMLVYHTVNQLLRNFNGTGRVSPKGLGGPILIVKAAYSFANSGMGKYLLFLCMLSANLAVLNILPIPVLDGGHVVFLLYEAIFRKPPNETVQIILSYMGLFLLLALMVWVFALDLGFIKRF